MVKDTCLLLKIASVGGIGYLATICQVSNLLGKQPVVSEALIPSAFQGDCSKLDLE